MEYGKLSKGPISLKILSTMAVMGMAITYCILVLHIFIDTEFKVPLIKEAYGSMDWYELVGITHKYFPYYGIYIFAFLLFLFVIGTSYSEKVKTALVIIPNCLIVLDIGSMWGISFINQNIFSWTLFFAGASLATSFAVIGALFFYDVWLRNNNGR